MAGPADVARAHAQEPPAGRRAPTGRAILATAAEARCRFVELHFTDVAGGLKSVVIPVAQLGETLEFGHWFDGSAIEGGARAMEIDLLLRPVLSTWGLLSDEPGEGLTARLICDVITPDGAPFEADPRASLGRVVDSSRARGVDYHVASEVEFYLFRAPAAGGPPATETPIPLDAGGYFDVQAQAVSVREDIVQALVSLGVPVTAFHHEIGPGQQEIDIGLLPALEAADAIVSCKYVVKAVARRRGLVASFMPKPSETRAGSGLHFQQAVLDTQGSDLLADPADEHGLSHAGRAFVAGQLAHTRALCAVLASCVNSYKRFDRGHDAPSQIAWGSGNPAAVIRVPRTPASRQSAGLSASALAPDQPTCIELRCADPACNPYLALAAALAAGLDGQESGAPLPPPLDFAGLASDAGGGSAFEPLPGSLAEAVRELEWDPVIRQALGAPIYERMLAAKEQEWREYRRHVTRWEIERYLESA
jgi:glutamine synthetase